MFIKLHTKFKGQENGSLKSGFTMIELLIVMLIGSVLMTGVVAVFIQQTKAMALNEDFVDLEQNLRVSMDMLHRDVRQAGSYLDLQNMPSFVMGDIYYKDKSDNMVLLTSDGGAGSPEPPDALQLRYSTQPGTGIKSYSGSSANFQVCHPSSLFDGQEIEISYTAKDGSGDLYSVNGIIEITALNTDKPCTGSATSCPGTCDKANFSPGQSEWNPSGGLIEFENSGNLWSGIETITYFVEPNDPSGPVLMRARGLDAPSVVAFGIINLQIIYRDIDGTPTTTLSDIRSVDIQVTGETRNKHTITGTDEKRTRTAKTEMLVRNLSF